MQEDDDEEMTLDDISEAHRHVEVDDPIELDQLGAVLNGEEMENMDHEHDEEHLHHDESFKEDL